MPVVAAVLTAALSNAALGDRTRLSAVNRSR
jgi:hypothetical protein